MQRLDVHAPAGVQVLVLRRERLPEPRHLVVRLRHAHALAQPADDGQVAPARGAHALVDRERGPQRRPGRDLHGGRHDADDRARLAVHPQRLPHRPRIGAEAAAPVAFGEQHHVGSVAGRIRFEERAAEERRRAEDAEEVSGRESHRDPLGLAAGAVDVRVEADEAGKAGEGRGALAPGEQVGRPRHVAVALERALLLPDEHQPLGLAERQRPHQHGVDDAPDGPGRRDAERDRRDGHEAEAGAADQAA